MTGILELIGGAGPEAHAIATISNDGAPICESTVAAGPFTIPYDRTAGDWTISFSARGFRSARFLLLASDTDLGTVRLARSYSYGGTVLGADGQPLAGVVVVMQHGAGRSDEAGSDGSFTIDMDLDVELGQGDSWARKMELHVVERGRFSLPIPASDDGWRHAHILQPEFPQEEAFRLRFVEFESRRPIEGVVAYSVPRYSNAPFPPPPAHRAVSDARGELVPDWPPWERNASWKLALPDGQEAWLSLDRDSVGMPVHDVLVGGPASARFSVRVLFAETHEPAAGANVQVSGWWLTGGNRGLYTPLVRLFGTVPDDGVLRWTLLVAPGSTGAFELEGWYAGMRTEAGIPVERCYPEKTVQVTPEHELPTICLGRRQGTASNKVWVAIRCGGALLAPANEPSYAELARGGVSFRGFPVHFTRDRVDLGAGGVAWLASIDSAAVREDATFDELVLYLRLSARRPQRFSFSREQVFDAASGRAMLDCAVRDWGRTGVLHVVRSDGTPAAGALATLAERDSWDQGAYAHLTHVAAGADGLAVVSDLVDGMAYAVGVHDPETGEAALVDDFAAGPQRTIRLLRPASVHFEVRTREGARVAGAYVQCDPVRAGLLPVRTCSGALDGSVDMASIAVSFYDILVRAEVPGTRDRLRGTGHLSAIVDAGYIELDPAAR